MVNFSRINCGTSATDTLMRAMEKAEEMRHVIVIYDKTDEAEERTGNSGGVFTQDEVTVSQLNWLIDCAKRWLFSD